MHSCCLNENTEQTRNERERKKKRKRQREAKKLTEKTTTKQTKPTNQQKNEQKKITQNQNPSKTHTYSDRIRKQNQRGNHFLKRSF